MYVSNRMRGMPYFHIQHRLLSRCVDWRYRDSPLMVLIWSWRTLLPIRRLSRSANVFTRDHHASDDKPPRRELLGRYWDHRIEK